MALVLGLSPDAVVELLGLRTCSPRVRFIFLQTRCYGSLSESKASLNVWLEYVID
jgi:hypothetical protein